MTTPVLVVDDQADTRELIALTLRDAGYEVLEAGNGRQALDLLLAPGREEPCLIVLDLEMPVMSGWELLAIARSYIRLASIPVLVLSVRQHEADALTYGAIAGYLAKPLDPEELARRVTEIVREHGGCETSSDGESQPKAG